MNTLRIGDVAKLVGRHPDTLRRYEAKGLIPAARRDPFSGWRLWSRDDVETIRRLMNVNEDKDRKR